MLRVLEPGALSTIQDGGRPAAAHLGVPISGACDSWSMAVANLLLDNATDAAVLEMTLLGATFSVVASGVIAIAGADMEAIIPGEGRSLASGRSHAVESGTTLRFSGAVRGMRAYLALPGGIDVEPILGSRSTCLAGQFGGLDGRPLAMGDVLAPSAAPKGAEAGRVWPSGAFDPVIEHVVRVVAVPDAPGVRPDAVDALVGRPWSVSPVGDRTGIRLEGDPLPTSGTADALSSCGIMPGAVELPPSGEPIIMLADAPTIGGYPVPAVVARADLPIVAQRQPGDDIAFALISIGDALEARGARRRSLEEGSGRHPVRYWP
jgi:5-oxoprolinase (ATP-hydrolysing) subunit C